MSDSSSTEVVATNSNEVEGRTVIIKVHCKNNKQTIDLIGCYAPTESSSDENRKEQFYLRLKQTTKELKTNKLPIIMLGDSVKTFLLTTLR